MSRVPALWSVFSRWHVAFIAVVGGHRLGSEDREKPGVLLAKTACAAGARHLHRPASCTAFRLISKNRRPGCSEPRRTARLRRGRASGSDLAGKNCITGSIRRLVGAALNIDTACASHLVALCRANTRPEARTRTHSYRFTRYLPLRDPTPGRRRQTVHITRVRSRTRVKRAPVMVKKTSARRARTWLSTLGWIGSDTEMSTNYLCLTMACQNPRPVSPRSLKPVHSAVDIASKAPVHHDFGHHGGAT